MLNIFQKRLFTVGCIALAACAAAEAGQGDATARNFAELCRDPLPANRAAVFHAQLEKAEKAVADADWQVAGDALGQAWVATYRGGSESDAGVRCLGPEITRRWFDTRLALWRQGMSVGLGRGGPDYTTLYVASLDNGSNGLVQIIRSRPPQAFAGLYRSTHEIIDTEASARAFGAPVLPEEATVAANARAALPDLEAYARSAHARALAAENVAFTRPPTQREQQTMDSLNAMTGFAGAMVGVDTGLEDTRETMLMEARTSESRQQLQLARDYEVTPVFGASTGRQPSDERAMKRGNELLAIANDESRSLPLRDQYYNSALRFYEFCACRDKLAATRQAKASIQPALAAWEAEREKRIEAKQAELQQQAEQTRQSIKDMQKTEEEKKSFQEEADAMEAELGF